MKKLVFLMYGIVSYVIFFATFCYAMGFVSTFLVPKHIDSTPQSPLGYALLVDAGLLAVFALQHSIMARPAFKKWWTRFVPEPIERSTYVLLASLCLILLFWKWEPIGGVIWSVESETARLVLQLTSMFGFTIVLVSTFLINHFDLFGLRQVGLYFTGKTYQSLSFRTPFFYKYVRHPLYLGFMIAFWSTPVMTAAHLFFAFMTTTYMLIAIRFEEKDLVDHFGARYQDYKRTAPMIIPFVNRADRKKKSFESHSQALK
ncbi:isoprenylcysteine carboxylmethyltransferase family protein [Dyadobacter sp. CY261]|uniref:methanethiol S-methyltransferase n=1 Tax=Dyadobacter sp. CY261 TaxID=2907203 RepID=UPI001F30F86F|nr:methanethiol S-methyltransferase [Dyadobacter sp. CY261]MCF0072896.1 isoprenylcysteine carboxylmethyltransferase family protein [Dyadobacter sp. CY261]